MAASICATTPATERLLSIDVSHRVSLECKCEAWVDVLVAASDLRDAMTECTHEEGSVDRIGAFPFSA